MTDDPDPPSRDASGTSDADDAFQSWIGSVATALQNAERGYADVYVRSMLPPAGAKAPQVDCLQRLEAVLQETSVDDVRLNVWGERLCLCDTCQATDVGRAMLDTVREFENWGAEFDATVEPFFERRHVESSITDETHDGIIPPRFTVALYLDSVLSGVFPCRMGERNYSVSDFCDVVESVSGVTAGGPRPKQHR